MLALVKSASAPGFSVEKKPIPTISKDEVLIKIRSNAICGTDIHIYDWDTWAQKTIPIPLIIGHEFMGEIAAIGEAITHLKIGQRVTGEGHVTCGECHHCRADLRHLCPKTRGIGIQRDGAFAEYLRLPAYNVIPIPDAISDDIATLMDPLGNAVHTALAFDLVGEDVLVTGAGPIGLMAIKIAVFTGAKRVVVTDINPYRLSLAKTMGATHALEATSHSLETLLKDYSEQDPFQFTIGLEVSGNESALKTQISTLVPGGHLALLGIPKHPISLDLSSVIFKGLTLEGIYGRRMFKTWEKMIAMLLSGLEVSPVITHHFNILEFESAFNIIKSGQAGKVLLHWPER